MNRISRKKKILITSPVIIIIWSGLFFLLGTRYQIHRYDKQAAKSAKLVSGVKATKITSGVVTKVTSDQLEMKDLHGAIKKFSVSERTTITKDGKKIKLSAIKVNDRARVIPELSDGTKARQVLIVVDQPSS